MRILIVIPHSFGATVEGTTNRSTQVGADVERSRALTVFISNVHQAWGRGTYRLDHGKRTAWRIAVGSGAAFIMTGPPDQFAQRRVSAVLTTFLSLLLASSLASAVGAQPRPQDLPPEHGALERELNLMQGRRL